MKSSEKLLKWLGLAVVLTFGLLRDWIGRFSMDADGISYLDLSDAFRRHDWHGFLNAYWSPLYPVLLGIVRTILPAGKQEELIAAHVLNFLIFVAALACFELFYLGLVQSLELNDSSSKRGSAAPSADSLPLPEWALWAVGHALFLWASLDLITIWGVCPDLCVSAFVYAIAGLTLRFRNNRAGTVALGLGIVLGASYWAKAAMFPLAFVFMAIAVFSVHRQHSAISWSALKSASVLVLSFAIVAGPLVVALSRQKHRLTFGDSGRINYAMFVSPGGVTRNWQGEPQLGIVAPHPSRKIFSTPPLYEFAEPIGGTFPLWYDPSYWEEGRIPLFSLKRQIAMIATHLASYAELLLHQENCLLASFLALALISRRKLLTPLAQRWPLLAMCLAALGLYALVHAEDRFIGGYVVILWLAMFSAIRLPSSLVRLAGYLLLAVSAALLVTVADNTARAVRDGGPSSALQDVALSSQLDAAGVRAGDRIAIIGGAGIYAARLSHLKVIAEIMGEDTPAFWRLNSDARNNVYQKFAECGARLLLAPDPGPAASLDPGWTKIPSLPFYFRWLVRSP